MKLRIWCLGTTLLIVGVFASGQSPGSSDGELRLADIREQRTDVEADASLDDALRARILEQYDAAISALNRAQTSLSQVATADRERTHTTRMVEALKRELERPEKQPQLPKVKRPTVLRALDTLARERSRLEAHRGARRDVERLAEERANSRSDIARRLGELDQELERLEDDLRLEAQRDVHPDLKKAARIRVLARRQAAKAEAEALRAKLALLGEQSTLTPLQLDQAQRRVAYNEQLVETLEEATAELRRETAKKSLEELRTECRAVAEKVPHLADTAAETTEFGELLWGTDGIVAIAERTTRKLLTTRNHLAKLDRLAELTRRKFDAVGHRGSIERWWPRIPEDFPEPGEVETVIDDLEALIPSIEHQLITFEQDRASRRERALTLHDLLTDGGTREIDTDVERSTISLLATRRDLLDRLIRQYGRTSSLLVEYRSVAEQFLRRLNDVERFLYAKVLWVRSVPRPVVPRLADILDGGRWLVSREFREIVSDASTDFRPVWRRRQVLGLITALALFGFRRRIRERLIAVAPRPDAGSPASLRTTLRAYVLTLLLAAPLPLFLYTTSAVLHHAGGGIFVHAATRATFYIAWLSAVLELSRYLLAPRGIAEAHYSWPGGVVHPLRRGFLLAEVFSLPFLYVAAHLAMAGIRLDSPSHLTIYSNSLGRTAFVVGMLILGGMLLGLLRPHDPNAEPPSGQSTIWHRRFANYAFPTAVVWASPVVALTTFVPAVLAIAGFYVTGLLLAYQMLRTLSLLLLLLLIGGLVFRWRTAAVQRARERAESEMEVTELHVAEGRVRQLLRFAIVLAMAFGLSSIWSDAVPMLEAFKRVQIWPTVTVAQADESAGLTAGTGTARPAGGTSTAEAPPSASGPKPDNVNPLAGPGAGGTAGTDSATSLTLWNLLQAILAGLLTLILARNLPALLELMLQRRTAVDSGARVAFSTLVRYGITIIGVTAVFGSLGVSWSKVQWLAAALTFGLGFGLQEIVANFVSGLILLIERPVRVGDVVTIGNLMGRVTRIQIRATTITLWDRSEMIVPNREFITSALVNWTLSDSKRRVDIPVRIAYGTDFEKVKVTLIRVAGEHPDVLPDPAPQALLLGFGDDAVKFELRFVVEFGRGLTCKDEVQMAIDRAFRQVGIEFALPKLDIRLPAGDSIAPSKA